ncbi:terminase small subunit [Burkholderia multivorans]|uniref:terminase small subunit n=1 Tax=Burkholderia multivorans TaxID=87883 RepID=UPI001C238851|nr:terminase small subunit [Burkholderia multivorans]MBU9224712.1 terminase small subunit [Burkholderia multivorans]MBU9420440.1 terminase small subunit [Burkholderia multivorans]MBU9480333.1 terminase small subunit [Burkholderia multivorans]
MRLETDPYVPVASRGAKGGGWRFDTAAVAAYLGGCAVSPDGSKEFDAITRPSAQLARVATVEHRGEHWARQRRDAVQAERLEDKLRRNRGELVQTDEMRHVIQSLQGGINKGLDRLASQIVELSGISEADAIVRDLVDELRDMMAADLRPLLERHRI